MLKMEIKEAEKVVIAKPVASRPTCCGFRSFSELLAGAINASPSKACSEAAVTAIRPRTVRFKPAVDHPLAGLASSKADLSGGAVYSPSYKDLKVERKSNVVYKPMAKLVSKATVSLLANMRSANVFQKQELAGVEANSQRANLVKHHCDLRSELHQNFQSMTEKNKRVELEPSNTASENLEADQRSLSHTVNGEHPSYDKYNWRKYGQKQVKGSEYPRSYYKCTHPKCPVKKKVERSLDGQIAEIVYRGEHNHPKPQPLKPNSSDGQRQGSAGYESNNPLWSHQHREKNECYEGSTENQNEFGLSAHSSYLERAPSFIDPTTAGASNIGFSTLDTSCHREEFDERRGGLDGDTDEPRSKRKKYDNQSNETCRAAEGTQEARVLVQNSIDSETIRDGFRWRKYGQKVMKGNPYPRSYYRCTNLKCNVRKYVERMSDDPKAFITTYEGKHNHEMPIKNRSTAAAKTKTKKV